MGFIEIFIVAEHIAARIVQGLAGDADHLEGPTVGAVCPRDARRHDGQGISDLLVQECGALLTEDHAGAGAAQCIPLRWCRRHGGHQIAYVRRP